MRLTELNNWSACAHQCLVHVKLTYLSIGATQRITSSLRVSCVVIRSFSGQLIAYIGYARMLLLSRKSCESARNIGCDSRPP